MDAARTAMRLGCAATVLYRRGESQMPAIAEEVSEAREEGVAFHFLAAPTEVIVEGGHVKGLRCQQMRLGEPDASGRQRPVPIEGSLFDLAADAVIVATGQELDVSALAEASLHVRGSRILINEAGATAIGSVFAGGDAATGEGTVAKAIGSGKRAALAIDQQLRTGRVEDLPPLGEAVHAKPREASAVVVRPDDLNLDYVEVVPRISLPQRPAAQSSAEDSAVVEEVRARGLGARVVRRRSGGHETTLPQPRPVAGDTTPR